MYHTMLGLVPIRVVAQLADAGIDPKTIWVQSPLIEGLLSAVADTTRWTAKLHPHPPGIAASRVAFEKYFSGA